MLQEWSEEDVSHYTTATEDMCREVLGWFKRPLKQLAVNVVIDGHCFTRSEAEEYDADIVARRFALRILYAVDESDVCVCQPATLAHRRGWWPVDFGATRDCWCLLPAPAGVLPDTGEAVHNLTLTGPRTQAEAGNAAWCSSHQAMMNEITRAKTRIVLRTGRYYPEL
jgi:hypothetical protein